MVSIHDNIVLAPVPHSGYSAIAMFFAGGSSVETGKTDVAHLLEHTVVEQMKSGLTLHGETRLEGVLFVVTQAATDTCNNLKELKRVLCDDPVDTTDFRTQQERVKLELLTAYPPQLFKDAYGKLFGKSSGQYRECARPIEGVAAVTVDDVLAYKRKYFTSRNSVVAVVGDFDEGAVLDTIATLSFQQPLTPPTAHRGHVKNRIVWNTKMEDGFADIDIFIQASHLADFRGRSVDVVLQRCLVGGKQSLLDGLLYKELGTAYFIETELLHWVNGGMLAFGYRTLADVAEGTADRVHELLKKLPSLITEDTVAFARDLVTVQNAIRQADHEKSASRLAVDLLLTGAIFSDEQQDEYVTACSLSDIRGRAEQIASMPTVVVKQ